jgi:hydroxymethylbilane synthase
VIRLGSRGSALALAQAGSVAQRLGDDVEIVSITTSGDRLSARGPHLTPSEGGDKARFVKEIEEALVVGEIDLAVHSAKDLPGELPKGLAIVAVPPRADPRDALCGVPSLDALSEGAVVGTASVRRRAQLLALRPDLEIRELRGNVDTRLRRLAEGAFDAIVLAQAGLDRLSRGDEGVPLSELVPAPGQGCLALEARRPSPELSRLTDDDALTALTAERALVAALGATCHTPIGAHAAAEDHGLRLTAFVGLPDGSHWIRDELLGDPAEPESVGREAALRLESAGARELLAEAERFAQAQGSASCG